jgi:hypothetical protein
MHTHSNTRRHTDGSIDYDFYRREAARLREQEIRSAGLRLRQFARAFPRLMARLGDGLRSYPANATVSSTAK